MLYREIIAVCSEIHTKHINAECGQNAELLNVNLISVYMYFPNSWVLYLVLCPSAVACTDHARGAAHGLLLRVLTSSYIRGQSGCLFLLIFRNCCEVINLCSLKCLTTCGMRVSALFGSPGAALFNSRWPKTGSRDQDLKFSRCCYRHCYILGHDAV